MLIADVIIVHYCRNITAFEIYCIHTSGTTFADVWRDIGGGKYKLLYKTPIPTPSLGLQKVSVTI